MRGTASDSLPEGVGKVFDGGKAALLRRVADGQSLREEGARMLQADLLQIGIERMARLAFEQLPEIGAVIAQLLGKNY